MPLNSIGNMKTYVLMHQDKQVAAIREDGVCTVFSPQFMPWNLQLTETDDPDTRARNLERFCYWCVSRLLTLDRANAKSILLSHGILQAETNRDRAQIALSCHGLCLTDVFWIRDAEEDIDYSRINLFDNLPPGEYVDVVLRDNAMIAQNTGLIVKEKHAYAYAGIIGNPNVWLRLDGRTLLLKHGNPVEVETELIASRIARCFDVPQVLYDPMEDHGRLVSCSELVTTKDMSFVSLGEMAGYLAGEGKTLWEYIDEQDAYGFHMMNIVDYLIGNTDRHGRNWGFWVMNDSNTPGKLMPLMDFNHSFREYDSLDGGDCLTTKEPMSQKEAAVRGIQAVGLRLVRALPDDLPAFFAKLNKLQGTRLDDMFKARLEVLTQSHFSDG